MSEVPTRLLRDALRDRGAAEPPPSCIDADTMAAWADGTLTARERDIVESHAADCARCQALFAAMARTAPPVEPRGWWRRPAFVWIVPLTVGAAAALVVFVNVDRMSRTMQVARSEPPPPSAGPAAPRPDQAAQHLDKVALQRAEAKRDAQVPAPRVGPGALAPKSVNAVPLGELAAPAETSNAGQSSKVESRARGAALGARAEAAAPLASADAAAAATPPPPARAAGSAPAAPPAPPPPPSPMAERVTLADGAAGGLMAKSVAQPIIRAQDSGIQWRVAQAGGVERSIDGGASWQAQSTGSGVRLTAGSAPSGTICWFVGPRGMVVITTDARTWQRVPLGEPIDLVSVQAVDDKNATVTASDGRKFTTTDGGRTWR